MTTDPKVVELFPKKTPQADYDPMLGGWPDNIIAAATRIADHPPFLMVMRAHVEKQVYEASMSGYRRGFNAGVGAAMPYIWAMFAVGVFVGWAI